ncbi:MAG: tRNA pseudouridine(55) synthase TruB [Polyangiaceae bacterium]|nr:tRNA pseudouridine(55) synthase TruB [Polyangiaceae bacterium]
MTSHDVVARVRRVVAAELGGRAGRRRGGLRVGHAGTLDPLASGVLVVMLGEATKLAPWLTADDKRYETTVVLGVGTDTLDADGTVVAVRELPAWLGDPDEARARLEAVLDVERARTRQHPPAYSAIQVGGVRAHAAARAGAELELAPREIAVRTVALTAIRRAGDHAELELELAVSKGYYVRALGRDLGAALGLPAHLVRLRRTASGAFALAEAVTLDRPGAELCAALRPTAEAALRALPRAELTADGVPRARQGKLLELADFAAPPPSGGPSAWVGPDGELVAVGERDEAHARVVRGFGTGN